MDNYTLPVCMDATWRVCYEDYRMTLSNSLRPLHLVCQVKHRFDTVIYCLPCTQDALVVQYKEQAPRGTLDTLSKNTGTVISTYATSYLIPGIAANIAFLGIAIIIFVIYILW